MLQNIKTCETNGRISKEILEFVLLKVIEITRFLSAKFIYQQLFILIYSYLYSLSTDRVGVRCDGDIFKLLKLTTSAQSICREV